MAENRILPLGFIDRITEDGAIIMLTRPSDSRTLLPGTPVTLRARSRRKTGATARARGLITGVGNVTATFKTVEIREAVEWPEGEQVLRLGAPVYQALADGYEHDPVRAISPEESEGLARLAARYRNITRPKKQQPEVPRERDPSRNGAHPAG